MYNKGALNEYKELYRSEKKEELKECSTYPTLIYNFQKINVNEINNEIPNTFFSMYLLYAKQFIINFLSNDNQNLIQPLTQEECLNKIFKKKDTIDVYTENEKEIIFQLKNTEYKILKTSFDNIDLFNYDTISLKKSIIINDENFPFVILSNGIKTKGTSHIHYDSYSSNQYCLERTLDAYYLDINNPIKIYFYQFNSRDDALLRIDCITEKEWVIMRDKYDKENYSY
jgi:hypothetical protein